MGWNLLKNLGQALDTLSLAEISAPKEYKSGPLSLRQGQKPGIIQVCREYYSTFNTSAFEYRPI